MLQSGERQVAPVLDGIRRDHVARYEWASQILWRNRNATDAAHIIDAGCGIGYGSNVLAQAGHTVKAFDADAETIAYANAHYAHEQVEFLQLAAEDFRHPEIPADAVVCFEVIEHLADPKPLLRSLHAAAPIMLASVPNEEVFPYLNYAFHHRHYTPAEFEALLNETGWQVTEWYGQQGPESDVEKGMMGRTIIVVARRKPELRIVAIPARSETSVPESVAILGLGPSLEQYVDIAKRLGGRHKVADEVWGINSLGSVIQCDRIFHMDDVRIQQLRSEARPQSNIAAMLDWMKHHPGPIYTSRPHPDYPGLVAYPLEDVLNTCGYDYFNSTAAYAVAFAIHLGVKKLSLWGCDFTYPKAHDAEKGRACVEFWLGMASERGIRIQLPTKTSLMDALHGRAERLYGYDTVNVDMQHDGQRMRVVFTERETLPTADEIEARYDHNTHPSPLMSGK